MGYVVNKRRFMQSGSSGYTVTIVIDSHINHTGGDLVQSNLTGAMTTVTLSPEDTYRIDQLSGSSGITVTASGNNYIISGTPTADVTINCTTTQNPNLLLAIEQDISTWRRSNTSSYATYGYQQSVSSNNISWQVRGNGSSSYRNEAYCHIIDYFASDYNAGNFIFEIRYKSSGDYGCIIGISSRNSNGNVTSYAQCTSYFDISAEYTTVSVPCSLSSSPSYPLYLYTSGYGWNSGNVNRSGLVEIDSISLRRV